MVARGRRLTAGFNAETLDWRYTLVQPNGKIMGKIMGKILGETNGASSNKVNFCYTCHNAQGAQTDAMTFLPEMYRR